MMAKVPAVVKDWPTAGKCRFWLNHVSQSMPRTFVYHYGLLARDKGQWLADPDPAAILGCTHWVPCEEVTEMGRLAWDAAVRGDVMLVQRRFEEMWYEYIAVRCESRDAKVKKGDE